MVPRVSFLLFKSNIPFCKFNPFCTSTSRAVSVIPAGLFTVNWAKGLMEVLVPVILCKVLPLKVTILLFGVKFIAAAPSFTQLPCKAILPPTVFEAVKFPAKLTFPATFRGTVILLPPKFIESVDPASIVKLPAVLNGTPALTAPAPAARRGSRRRRGASRWR